MQPFQRPGYSDPAPLHGYRDATIQFAQDPLQGALVRQGGREYMIDASGVQNYFAQLKQQAELGMAAQQQLLQIMSATNPATFGVPRIGHNASPSQSSVIQGSAAPLIHQARGPNAAEDPRVRDVHTQQQQSSHSRGVTYPTTSSQQVHRPNTVQPSVTAAQSQWQLQRNSGQQQQSYSVRQRIHHQNAIASSSRAPQGIPSSSNDQGGSGVTFFSPRQEQSGDAHQGRFRQASDANISTSTSTPTAVASAQLPRTFGSPVENVVAPASSPVTPPQIPQAQNNPSDSDVHAGQSNYGGMSETNARPARTYSRPQQVPANNNLGEVLRSVVDKVGLEKAKDIFALWLSQRSQAGPSSTASPSVTSNSSVPGANRPLTAGTGATPTAGSGQITHNRADPPPANQTMQPEAVNGTLPVVGQPEIVPRRASELVQTVQPVHRQPVPNSPATSLASSVNSSAQPLASPSQAPSARPVAPSFQAPYHTASSCLSTSAQEHAALLAAARRTHGSDSMFYRQPAVSRNSRQAQASNQQIPERQAGQYLTQTAGHNVRPQNVYGSTTSSTVEHNAAQARVSGSIPTSSSPAAGQLRPQSSVSSYAQHATYAQLAQMNMHTIPRSEARALPYVSSPLSSRPSNTSATNLTTPLASSQLPATTQATVRSTEVQGGAQAMGTQLASTTAASSRPAPQPKLPHLETERMGNSTAARQVLPQTQEQLPEQDDPGTYIMTLPTSGEVPEAVRRPPNRKTLARDLLRSLGHRSAEALARGGRENKMSATSPVATSQPANSQSGTLQAAIPQVGTPRVERSSIPRPMVAGTYRPVSPADSHLPEPVAEELARLPSNNVLDSELLPPSSSPMPPIGLSSPEPPLAAPHPRSAGPTVIDLTGSDTPPEVLSFPHTPLASSGLPIVVPSDAALPAEPYIQPEPYVQPEPYIHPVHPMNILGSGLSFGPTTLPIPTRTPTPPLMATITDVDDEREVIEISSGTATEVGRPSEAPSLPEEPTGTAPHGTVHDRTASISMVEDSARESEPLFVRRPGLLDSPVKSRLKLLSQPSKRRKMEMYVLVPTPPEYVEHFRRKRQRLEEEKEDERAVQAVVEESMDILRPCKCYWDDCGDVLNSGHALWKHMTKHVKVDAELVTCQFNHCGAVLGREGRSRHFRRHASHKMPCPYHDCDEGFFNEEKLYDHTQEQHEPYDDRKPSATPLRPVPPEQSSMLPKTLPSYMSSTRLVSTERVSEERHSKLGPWALRQMAGAINLQSLKNDALTSSRKSLRLVDRTAKPHNGELPDLNLSYNRREDQYDFLDWMTGTPPDYCDDLDSQAISLILFEDVEGEINDEEHEDSPEPWEVEEAPEATKVVAVSSQAVGVHVDTDAVVRGMEGNVAADADEQMDVDVEAVESLL